MARYHELPNQDTRPRTANLNNRGFTLVEVIIAFVIMALILGATFDTFSTGLRQAVVTGHYAGAVVRAESQLALFDHTETLAVGVRTGRFDPLYTWRTEIAPVTQDDTEAPGEGSYRLYNVVLTVFWGEGDVAREVTLRSQRLNGPEKP